VIWLDLWLIFRSKINKNNSRPKKPKTGQAPTEINMKPAKINIAQRVMLSSRIPIFVLD